MNALRIVLVAVAIFLLQGCSPESCISPEDDLRSNFTKRLPSLDAIRAMSDEDTNVIRIAPTFTRLKEDWSWPRPEGKLGFSEKRWNEYRKLFTEVGAETGLDREGDIVLLTISACGLGVSGKSYGYAYLRSPPPQLAEKLKNPSSKGIAYVPLQGKWYMFVWGT